MAGAGIFQAQYDGTEFQEILDALSKASDPKLEQLAWFMGKELQDISEKAFEQEKDPVTGKKWDAIQPRGSEANVPGSVTAILRDHGILHSSLTHNDSPEGTVFGSHMEYARIHQMGGQAGRNKSANIPARPYMGVPKDFDRRVLNDPAVLDLLGIGG
ncbi:MAG: phage virion morphogenesis protein [Treponema sp.]|jgi:phage virion morphogenesis protein|nr:phage virion morphogenesis protein [Treponema sp.]